jgi:hypothetical protein
VLVTFFGGVIVGIPLTRLAAEFEMKLLRTGVGRVSILTGLMILVVLSSWLMRAIHRALKKLSFEDREDSSPVSLNLVQGRTSG